MPLSDASLGDSVMLRRVTETIELDDVAMTYLSDNGFITGRSAEVAGKAPDGSLSLKVGDNTVVLGSLLGENLYVSIS